MDRELHLSRDWKLGDKLGGGGFGVVYVGEADGQQVAVKLIPKAPGADRELLFVDLAGVPNVVPIIDQDETPEHWVVVMPRAECSLRDHLDRHNGMLSVAETIEILCDICDALVALDGRQVVHRDLKPGNVLLLGGKWCVTDFGISRYAEATTALDTHKFAGSPPYIAPERWRSQRATSATDVYSFGTMAFEMIMGRTPFEGDPVDLRHHHLHDAPPQVEGAPAPLSALIEECLFKSPGSRPTAENIRQRLDRLAEPAGSPGLSLLQEANLAEARHIAEQDRLRSEEETAQQRRMDLEVDAARALARISEQLLTAVTSAAPSATHTVAGNSEWALELGSAKLGLAMTSQPRRLSAMAAARIAIDVVCVSRLTVWVPSDQNGYTGRSHSLWFCDAQKAGEYRWYETAFMFSPMVARQSNQDPFALDPGDEAYEALLPGMGAFQVAWPFTPLTPGELDEFVDRWAGWFAQAAQGKLGRSRSMPERPPRGSWRTS